MKDSKLGDSNRREFLSRAATLGGLVATSGPLSLMLSGCADVNPTEPIAYTGAAKSLHGGAHFVNDTFTGANNTEISTHTGETGATWTKHPAYTSGEARIDANRCRGHSAPAAYYASGVPADANYYVETVCYVANTDTTYAGGVVRMSTSADTMYYSYYDGSAWQIMKRVAGIVGPIGSGWAETLSANDSRTVRLEVSGTGATVTLNLYVNGTLRDTASDNQSDRIVAVGRPGLRIPVAGTAGTGMQLASITAVDSSSGAANLASNSFESGTISPYVDIWDANPTVINDPTPRVTGKVVDLFYGMAAVNTSAGHVSLDASVAYDRRQSSGGTPIRYGYTLWSKGKLYIPDPGTAERRDHNRKLIDYAGGGPSGIHTRIVWHVDDQNLKVAIMDWRNGYALERFDDDTGLDLNFDTWHTIETRITTNSASAQTDGVIELYVDGASTPNYSRSTGIGWITDAYTLGGESSSFFSVFYHGSQLTVDQGHTGYDEHRYWDDVAFSTSRIS